MVIFFTFIKKKKEENNCGEDLLRLFWKQTFKGFICTLPLKEQQVWKDGEYSHWLCRTWGGEDTSWYLCSVVERFLPGEGKASIGNIRNLLFAVTFCQISTVSCCKDGDDEKSQQHWLLFKYSLKLQQVSIACEVLLLQETQNNSSGPESHKWQPDVKHSWFFEVRHVVKCCRSHADVCLLKHIFFKLQQEWINPIKVYPLETSTWGIR